MNGRAPSQGPYSRNSSLTSSSSSGTGSEGNVLAELSHALSLAGITSHVQQGNIEVEWHSFQDGEWVEDEPAQETATGAGKPAKGVSSNVKGSLEPVAVSNWEGHAQPVQRSGTRNPSKGVPLEVKKVSVEPVLNGERHDHVPSTVTRDAFKGISFSQEGKSLEAVAKGKWNAPIRSPDTGNLSQVKNKKAPPEPVAGAKWDEPGLDGSNRNYHDLFASSFSEPLMSKENGSDDCDHIYKKVTCLTRHTKANFYVLQCVKCFRTCCCAECAGIKSEPEPEPVPELQNPSPEAVPTPSTSFASSHHPRPQGSRASGKSSPSVKKGTTTMPVASGTTNWRGKQQNPKKGSVRAGAFAPPKKPIKQEPVVPMMPAAVALDILREDRFPDYVHAVTETVKNRVRQRIDLPCIWPPDVPLKVTAVGIIPNGIIVIQTTRKQKEVEEMMVSLKASCRIRIPPTLLDYVAVTHDSKFYRGQIEEICKPTGKCRVRLVDLGKIVVKGSHEIFYLPMEFLKIPRQMGTVSPINVSVKDGDATKSYFEKRLIGKEIEVTLTHCHAHLMHVKHYYGYIYFANTDNELSELLIQKGLAEYHFHEKDDSLVKLSKFKIETVT